MSYSHLDIDFVRQLSSDCEEHGIEILRDEKILLAGDSIISKIQDAIDRALLVVVVLSKHSLNSGWVKKELEQATIAEIEGRTKVIPIIRDQVEHIPGFLRPKLYANFSGWPDDKEQYSRSLDLLRRSIIAHKNGLTVEKVSGKFTKNPSGKEHAPRLLSDTLLRQLPLKYVDDWPLGRVFKGTFLIKKGYIDGANNVWKVNSKSIQSLVPNAPELKIGSGIAGRFIGEDHQGRLWYLTNRELFVFLDQKWVGIPLPNMADSTRVSLWTAPPAGVVGPVVPEKNSVSILSTSGWGWKRITSPLGIPQANSGSGTSLLIANSDSWALTQSLELGWDKVARFTSRMSKPLLLVAQPSCDGFWMHCADHTLFWVKTDDLRRAPLPIGVKQGLPGARADIVITRRKDEVWCAGSGGLAFSAPGSTNQFTVLTDRVPQLIWSDSASRVWGLFNKEIWCWVEEENS